jgi:ubiquinone/menaquinone biosynthesis C-methylase UbiE
MRQAAFGARMQYQGPQDLIWEAFRFVPADASEAYYAALVSLVVQTIGHLEGVATPIRVVDVGAGVGRVAYDVARESSVGEVVAVEQYPELIQELELVASGAERLVSVPVSGTRTLSATLRLPGPAPRLRVVAGDAHTLPFDDASVSCVLAFGLLDRVARPQAVADEFSRVLVSGGAAIVSCLHDFSGGPADRREWLTSAADVFSDQRWSNVVSRNERLNLRQNARFVESFDAEIVVAHRTTVR